MISELGGILRPREPGSISLRKGCGGFWLCRPLIYDACGLLPAICSARAEHFAAHVGVGDYKQSVGFGFVELWLRLRRRLRC